MGLSTKELGGTSGAGIPKTIVPGNHRLKIYSVELEPFSFIENAYHLVFRVETEPLEDFEGFFIDKENESLGRHAGQVGKVRASMYAFSDGVTKTGIKIDRDRNIMIALKTLSNNLGISEWFESQDNLHNTIEDFVEAFNKTAPYQNIYLDFCIAGKEYLDKNGYIGYNLYLPKGEKNKYAYGSIKDGKVMTYNESVHLKKHVAEEVKNFEDTDDLSIPKKASIDFDLD